jgi:hypothetical protein
VKAVDVQGLGFRVQGSGCRVEIRESCWCLGFRVQGLGLKHVKAVDVQGSGFRV